MIRIMKINRFYVNVNICCFLLILAGCRGSELSSTKQAQSIVLKPESLKVTDTSSSKSMGTDSDSLNIRTPNYLHICEELSMYIGGIQHDTVTRYIFPMGECNDKYQFELLLVPKRRLYLPTDSDSLIALFESEREFDYPSFNILAIESPKRSVDQYDSEFDKGLIFPCEAKVFTRINNKWSFTMKRTTLNFKEFTKLQVDMMQYLHKQR